MSLNLYRRHRRDCKSSHVEDSSSGQFEERKKGWKRCECPIFVSGTLAGRFKRNSTNQWDWDRACSIASQLEVAGSWTGRIVQPEPTTTIPGKRKVTIDEAVDAFLAERQESVGENTLRKNRYLLQAFKRYSEEKGYSTLEQWDAMDVRHFRTAWGVGSRTGIKYMEIVRAYFNFCVGNGWIAANPAAGVKNPKGKQTHDKERIPFSDDELKRMYEACERYGRSGGEWRYRWTGEDLADFISVSTYTGLRISDVATFHIDRLHPNGECHIRTTKTGRKVYTWIPEWLQERVSRRAEVHGPLIFGSHATENINVMTDLWRRKLLRLWELCGPWKERPTPHRFRHSFARILLQKPGVTIRDVAELMGDTEQMILRHYSSWVEERQQRLTAILKEAFEDKPKPKLVSINQSGTDLTSIA